MASGSFPVKASYWSVYEPDLNFSTPTAPEDIQHLDLRGMGLIPRILYDGSFAGYLGVFPS